MIHGTAVAISDKGIILRGPPGSGKSDLALRLIDNGAVLVADDRIELVRKNNNLFACCPRIIAGKIEVRGIGILNVPYIEETIITMVVNLVTPDQVRRIREPDAINLLGDNVTSLKLVPFEASAVAKVRIALSSLGKTEFL